MGSLASVLYQIPRGPSLSSGSSCYRWGTVSYVLRPAKICISDWMNDTGSPGSVLQRILRGLSLSSGTSYCNRGVISAVQELAGRGMPIKATRADFWPKVPDQCFHAVQYLPWVFCRSTWAGKLYQSPHETHRKPEIRKSS